jgi:1,4-dihydroxy-2-naphthoyl-CoA hydrolase
MQVQGSIQFEITGQTPERVTGRMPVQPGILNPYGTVHAGATLWFADVCATILALGSSTAQPGQPGFPLAISLDAKLLGNQRDGELLATATWLKKGQRVSVVRTTVTGAGGRLVADVTTSHVPSG